MKAPLPQGAEFLTQAKGWSRVEVDIGWPPIWDYRHCGAGLSECTGYHWTIERVTDGWRLWRLFSRGNYEDGCVIGIYPSSVAAMDQVSGADEKDRCSHE